MEYSGITQYRYVFGFLVTCSLRCLMLRHAVRRTDRQIGTEKERNLLVDFTAVDGGRQSLSRFPPAAPPSAQKPEQRHQAEEGVYKNIHIYGYTSVIPRHMLSAV